MNADTLFSYADYVINDKEQVTEYTQKYFQDHKPEFLFKLFGYIRKCCHDQGDSYLLSSDMPVKDLLLDPDYFMAVSEWSYDTAAELADNAVHEFLENHFQVSITDNDFELVRTRADFFADIKIAVSVGKFQNANWVIKDFFGVENMSVKKCIDTVESEQIRQQDIDDQMIADYINQHVSEIAEETNKNFDLQKGKIRNLLITKIRQMLTPIPIHYENEYDGDPYDYSGILRADGLVDINQTVGEFLENEYSGNKKATHTSYYGWHYLSFGDELSFDTLNIGYNIMCETIKDAIQKKFGLPISDDRLYDIRDFCTCEFDPIYDECRACEFFGYEAAIDFVEISDWPLSEILENDSDI